LGTGEGGAWEPEKWVPKWVPKLELGNQRRGMGSLAALGNRRNGFPWVPKLELGNQRKLELGNQGVGSLAALGNRRRRRLGTREMGSHGFPSWSLGTRESWSLGTGESWRLGTGEPEKEAESSVASATLSSLYVCPGDGRIRPCSW